MAISQAILFITEIDNMSYHLGLGERAKERVDTYAHVVLTDEEAKKLPVVFLSRDIPWDPKRYDKVLSSDEVWKAQQAAVDEPIHE